VRARCGGLGVVGVEDGRNRGKTGADGAEDVGRGVGGELHTTGLVVEISGTFP
jgi:hypothetical protein